MNNPRIYRVGGAVRDQLLGRPIKDRDWVVVGSTPEAMLAQGFKAVGKSFPVFLHPKSHEEYALARTEKKTGQGHTAFECYAAPDVTLEEDLLRRDLTINAMAMTDDGTLIDPYGGLNDLHAGILRHVSPAFRDDPLRVLRVARFAARFNFTVAPETALLLQEMCASGELAHISQERLWKEWSEGLSSDYPHQMLNVLKTCDALKWVWKALDDAWSESRQLPQQRVPHYGEWLTTTLQNLPPPPTTVDVLYQRTALCLVGIVETLSAKMISLHTEAAQTARWTKPLIQFQRHCFQLLMYLNAPPFATSEEWATQSVRLFEQFDGLRRPEQAQALFDVFDSLCLLDTLIAWQRPLKQLQASFQSLRLITPHQWLGTVPAHELPQRLAEARYQAALSVKI